MSCRTPSVSCGRRTQTALHPLCQQRNYFWDTASVVMPFLSQENHGMELFFSQFSLLHTLGKSFWFSQYQRKGRGAVLWGWMVVFQQCWFPVWMVRRGKFLYRLAEEPSQVSKSEADQVLLQETPRLQRLKSASLNKSWYQSKQELEQFAPDKWLKTLKFLFSGKCRSPYQVGWKCREQK